MPDAPKPKSSDEPGDSGRVETDKQTRDDPGRLPVERITEADPPRKITNES